jgi:hypothetical protein
LSQCLQNISYATPLVRRHALPLQSQVSHSSKVTELLNEEARIWSHICTNPKPSNTVQRLSDLWELVVLKWLCYIYLFIGGIWTQGFMLTRQSLYHLSHTPHIFFSLLEFELRTYTLSHSTSPFLWRVFFKIGSHNCDPPDLCLRSSWDYSREPPVSSELFIYLF